jgi:hypothetical protein
MLSTFRSGEAIRLRGRVRVGGSTRTLVGVIGDLFPGEWRHAALTYDGTFVRLYLDGGEVNRSPLTGPVDQAPTVPVWVGGQPAPGSSFFDGLLDDVRILQRALSPEEIAGLAAKAPGAN